MCDIHSFICFGNEREGVRVGLDFCRHDVINDTTDCEFKSTSNCRKEERLKENKVYHMDGFGCGKQIYSTHLP